jgi:hypothetical protein
MKAPFHTYGTEFQKINPDIVQAFSHINDLKYINLETKLIVTWLTIAGW